MYTFFIFLQLKLIESSSNKIALGVPEKDKTQVLKPKFTFCTNEMSLWKDGTIGMARSK